MYLCTGEMVAENGRLGGCFSAPFPPEPQSVRLAALTLLGFSCQAVQGPPAHVFNIHSHSPYSLPSRAPVPFLQKDVFGSLSSVPKIDFFRSILRVMARDTNGAMFLTGSSL